MKLNLTDVEVQKPFEVVLYEPGTYNVVIKDAVVDTGVKDGITTEQLKLTYMFINGKHEGKKYVDSIRYITGNPIAQRIAQQSLKGLLIACGFDFESFDSENLPPFDNVKMEIYITKSSPKNDPSKVYNNVRSYAPLASDISDLPV